MRSSEEIFREIRAKYGYQLDSNPFEYYYCFTRFDRKGSIIIKKDKNNMWRLINGKDNLDERDANEELDKFSYNELKLLCELVDALKKEDDRKNALTAMIETIDKLKEDMVKLLNEYEEDPSLSTPYEPPFTKKWCVENKYKLKAISWKAKEQNEE